MRYVFGPQPPTTTYTFTACAACGTLHDHRQACGCRRLQASSPQDSWRLRAGLMLGSLLLAALAWGGVLAWLGRS
jgi:hypothetical protein